MYRVFDNLDIMCYQEISSFNQPNYSCKNPRLRDKFHVSVKESGTLGNFLIIDVNGINKLKISQQLINAYSYYFNQSNFCPDICEEVSYNFNKILDEIAALEKQ